MREPTVDNSMLSAQDVREEAAACLISHLPLAANGYMVTTDLLIDVLLHAAASGTSIEAACDNLLSSADANTVRGYLNDQLSAEDLVMLEERMNEALGRDLPRKLRRAKLEIAIDIHDQPFYGKSPGLRAIARRGEARSDTTYFMRIASVNTILHGLRITLGVVFVCPDDNMSEIVDLLCDRVRRMGLRIGHVCMGASV